MSEIVSKRTNNIGSVETVVEAEKIDDSSMLKIVNNVETRLIQESIQKDWREYGEIKRTWKDFVILTLSLLSVISSLSIVFGMEQSETTFLGAFVFSVVFFVIGFFGLPTGIIVSVSNSDVKKTTIAKKINSQRIELAEKMLNIEILKKDKVKITKEWDEIMALDNNNDYVKILIRVANDQETGLETIESKMLKNQ